MLRSLRQAISRLRGHYGAPSPPVSRDPFHLVLWEQVAYLAPDDRRRAAFSRLESEVGLRPDEILAARQSALTAITRAGSPIAASERATRIRASATLVATRWQGDLRRALQLPVDRARRELTRLPMIGTPGADKILALTGTARLLPIDSNALRVLQRLGVAPAVKDYAAAYRAAQSAVARGLPASPTWLAAAGQLLREHGQKLCRQNRPACAECPLQSGCPSAKEVSRGRR